MNVIIDSVLCIHKSDEKTFHDAVKANTHVNPKYAQAIEQRRSTFKVEKTINDYKVSGDILVIPRGYSIEFDQDLRVTSTYDLYSFNAKLRDYQKQVMNEIGDKDQGVIVAPTGAGKTMLGMALIAKRKQRSLILVHTKELMNQWKGQIQSTLGIEAGLVGGGKSDTDKPITVAMFQTLGRSIDKINVDDYGLVLIDECHHCPANTFAQVVDKLPAKYRYGLSATPERRDGLEGMLYNRIGPILSEISTNEVEAAGGIIPANITIFHTGFSPIITKGWSDYITCVIESEYRNKLIASIGKQAATEMPTLILTDRVEHAKVLHQITGGVLLHGQLNKSDRDMAMTAANTSSLTIGTTGLLGEGVDVSGWQALILATPLSSRSRLLQAIGRVIRSKEGKKKGFIADFVDNHPLSRSSYRKRHAVYLERSYTVSERR